MGDLNAGIFELAGENVDRERRRSRRAATTTCGCATSPSRPDVPITFGVFSRRGCARPWRQYLATCSTRPRAVGGRMFAQVHSRSLSALLSFRTQLPFDRLPAWKEIRKLPLDEQKRQLRDPELRAAA